MKNQQLAPHRKVRRKRGGQKGNQNARKHGFYSRALTPAEIGDFWNITRLEDIDPEVAALRIKLISLFQLYPGNSRVLGEASNLLAKWYRAKYRLDSAESSYLKKFIRLILDHLADPSPQNKVFSQNETERTRMYFNEILFTKRI